MAKAVVSENQKKYEGEMLSKHLKSAKNTDISITQEFVAGKLDVTQGVVGQWIKGLTALTDMRILELSLILGFDPCEFRPSLRPLVAGLRGNSNISPDIPTYSLDDAPVCEHEYLLRLPGGTIPDYNQAALFLCKKYDDAAREFAEYVVFRKLGSTIPVVCIQLGSKKQRNYLGELVGGRRVDRPELLHSLDSGEILCAIHSPKGDSHLWDKG